MIQAKELRIGNYIESEGDIFTVDYIELQLIGGWINDVFILTEPTHPSIKPIPLTEQWLIDLGAERIVGWDDMIIYRITHNQMSVDIEELDKGYENDMGMKIYSVHEYQNYVFSTIGKELTKQKTP